MSTKFSELAEDDRDDRTDDERRYPAEDAYGPRRDTPAWKRIEPDLSGGYVEVHLAWDAIDDLSHEEVTTT